MKRLFIIFALVWAVSHSQCVVCGASQDGRARVEQQVRHYTELFGLDETRSQQFATIYKAYCKQMQAIRIRYQQPVSGGQQSVLTDEQVEQRLMTHFAQSRAILDAREQYYKEFRQVLTPSQIDVILKDEQSRRSQLRGRKEE